MSRSYKKYACYEMLCGFPLSYMKRFANKSLRRYKYFDEVSNGGWFKKLFDSYEIHEGKIIMHSEFEIEKKVVEVIIKAQKDKLKENQQTKTPQHYSNYLLYNDKCYARVYYKWIGK